MNHRLRVWRALARGVILESVRRKDLYVVGIIGTLLVLGAGGVGFFGTEGLDLFARDLATTVVGFLANVIAVTVSARIVPEEIRHRTLYPLLARPVSRFDFLAGKLLGAIAVTWIAFLLLCALVAGPLLLFGVSPDVLLGQFVLAKLMGLAVVCAVSFTLSLLMTPSAAVTLSFVVVLGSAVLTRAFETAQSHMAQPLATVVTLIEALVPRVALFDLGDRASSAALGPVPAWVLGAMGLYAATYGLAMLAIGWLNFRRKSL